jgi:cellulose synthase/poly-beta-1,6-N-acetylglucosamine synthase-like glycosyltransferase
MIIQILSKLKEEGYLDKYRHPTAAPFLAGANVAFRRSALREIGNFDAACKTGEDCDICARLSKAGWDLYLRPEAAVSHKNPSTLRQLIGQWFGYGLYHPYVFAKHNDRAIELYVRLNHPLNGERYFCLFYRRSALPIVVFFSSLLLMHITIPMAVVFWIMGWSEIGWITVGMTLMLLAFYAWPDIKLSGLFMGSVFTVIRYIADAALLTGAFLGGLKQKMLYISATIG